MPREQACGRCVETRSIVEFESFIDKAGGRHWRRTALVPLFDTEGRLTRLMGTSRDITEQRAEEELQDQIAERQQDEQRFQRVFDEGPFAMVLVDMDRRIIDVNRAFCNLLGYSEDELIGMEADDIGHPDDIEDSRELARRLFKGEVPYFTSEKRYVRKDGRIVWGRGTGSLIRDKNGRPLYGLGMVEDISKRKLAEEVAVRATRLFEEAEQIAGLGSWELDLNTGRAYCSDHACRIFGVDADQPFYTRDELRAKIHPDDLDVSRKAYERLMATGEPIQVEYRVLPGGGLRHVQVRARLEMKSGQPNRIVGIARDITEAHQRPPRHARRRQAEDRDRKRRGRSRIGPGSR